jgi:hypothetical protein
VFFTLTVVGVAPIGFPINAARILFRLKTISLSSVVPKKFVADVVPELPNNVQSVDAPAVIPTQIVPL